MEQEYASWSQERMRKIGISKATRNPLVVAGLAVTLLGIGAFQGYVWAFSGHSPVVYEAGALVATGDLEEVLYDPSLGAREEGPEVGSAFTDKAGHPCRRFVDGPVRGVACRRAGDWRVTELRQD